MENMKNLEGDFTKEKVVVVITLDPESIKAIYTLIDEVRKKTLRSQGLVEKFNSSEFKSYYM